MKNFLKGKIGTVLILVVTLVLAGVAIFTALRLYQLRQTAVAPNAPTSIPKADVFSNCRLQFTIAAASTSPTPTGESSPTPTGESSPTPTGTGTPAPSGTPNSCGGTCGSNVNCASNLMCYQGFCRNPSCQTAANCVCGTGTPAPTKTPVPSLPQSGTGWPTIVGGAIGVFVIIGSLLLAL